MNRNNINAKYDLDTSASLYFTADFTLVENHESTPIFTSKAQSKINNQNQHFNLNNDLNNELSIDSRTDTLIQSFKRIQEDEYSILNQQLYSEFTLFVENTETDAFKRLNNYLKNEKSNFLTYDSAIEKIFDDIDLENKLEELLKKYACFSTKQSFQHNEYDISLKPEILFIEHSFCLIKFSKLNNMMNSYTDLFKTFFDKLEQIVIRATDQSIRIVASVFICLFNFDLNGMISNFKLIANNRWSVLKNLIYFSFKFALFHMFDLNDKVAKSSIGVILISIYQYIKNFNQI